MDRGVDEWMKGGREIKAKMEQKQGKVIRRQSKKGASKNKRGEQETVGRE